ncbi:MAG: periplasmic heavy metal sensor [Hyphomonas sp.]
MSEPQVRRFPFWLTLSVLGNLVLLGLIAGIFLNASPRFDKGRDRGGEAPRIELTDAERDGVRKLMRESFEAGREAMAVRREAERELADVLRAEVYDDAAARAALARLREADRVARETVGNHMFDGLAELSPDQRALVSKIMSGNLEKRGKRGERIEKFKERRDSAPPSDGPDKP